MNIQYRRQLPELIRELNLPMIACEVGCAEGNFSRDLLEIGMQKLFMVDAWEHIPDVRGDGNYDQRWHDANYMEALRKVSAYGDKAVILKGKSVEMARGVEDDSLSLLYLDADHSYEGVMSDLIAWFPKVAKGGVVAGHDYLSPDYGVNQAVAEFCADKYEVHLIEEDRPEDAGFYFIKT